MKIAIIDNIDDFTSTLKKHLEQFVEKVDVFKVSEIDYINFSSYDKFILGPGEGRPSKIKELGHLINYFQNATPILGICLGHQAIAEYYGARLVKNEDKDKTIKTKIVDKDFIFDGIEQEFTSITNQDRIIDKNSLPDDIVITAIDENGNIMAFRHRKYNVRGLQFYPSIEATPEALKIIENWAKS